MLLHNSPLFQIYFGNTADKLFSAHYTKLADEPQIITHKPFSDVAHLMRLQALIFLKQTHSTIGTIIDADNVGTMHSFAHEGDYLITGLSDVGIGVMTADCLPIIFFDNFNNVISIVHAGWRGSVQAIAVKALQEMHESFGTDKEHIQVFFGPSIKPCCYKVGAEFYDHINNDEIAQMVLSRHNDDIFFDLPYLNRILLEEAGVPKMAIRLGYNLCTMCDTRFNSYRRDGAASGRQMTVVCLK